MNESLALQMLVTNTMDFLKKNSITLCAAPKFSKLIHTFYMVDTLLHIKRPVSIFKHFKKLGSRYQVSAYGMTGGTPFQSINIPVQPSNADINGFLLPLHGACIMTTTQLSGCCIVMIPKNDTWEVAHLQPVGETGIHLRRRLADSGYKVYGATDYLGGVASFLGIRFNHSWKFFAQKQDYQFNIMDVKNM